MGLRAGRCGFVRVTPSVATLSPTCLGVHPRHLLTLFLTEAKQNPRILFDIYRFHNLVIAQRNIDHGGGGTPPHQICVSTKTSMGSPFPLPPRNTCRGLWRRGLRPPFLASRVRQKLLGWWPNQFWGTCCGPVLWGWFQSFQQTSPSHFWGDRDACPENCVNTFLLPFYISCIQSGPKDHKGPFLTVFFHLGLGLSLNMEVQRLARTVRVGHF